MNCTASRVNLARHTFSLKQLPLGAMSRNLGFVCSDAHTPHRGLSLHPTLTAGCRDLRPLEQIKEALGRVAPLLKPRNPFPSFLFVPLWAVGRHTLNMSTFCCADEFVLADADTVSPPPRSAFPLRSSSPSVWAASGGDACRRCPWCLAVGRGRWRERDAKDGQTLSCCETHLSIHAPE